MHILVVEDELHMLRLLSQGLHERGFDVAVAGDGEAGLEMAMAQCFDAVVLDLGLPRLDGCSLMQTLRQRGRQTPVLMLTARDAEDDIIRGLDLGADDYLTKPFSFPELVARLQAITRPVRATREDEQGALEVGELAVDMVRRLVTRNARQIELTRNEFALMVCLMRRAGECVPRRTLMECVWGPMPPVGESALDVLVNALRGKVEQPNRSRLIGTVRGAGYVLQGAGQGIAQGEARQ